MILGDISGSPPHSPSTLFASSLRPLEVLGCDFRSPALLPLACFRQPCSQTFTAGPRASPSCLVVSKGPWPESHRCWAWTLKCLQRQCLKNHPPGSHPYNLWVPAEHHLGSGQCTLQPPVGPSRASPGVQPAHTAATPFLPVLFRYAQAHQQRPADPSCPSGGTDTSPSQIPSAGTAPGSLTAASGLVTREANPLGGSAAWKEARRFYQTSCASLSLTRTDVHRPGLGWVLNTICGRCLLSTGAGRRGPRISDPSTALGRMLQTSLRLRWELASRVSIPPAPHRWPSLGCKHKPHSDAALAVGLSL